MIIDELFEGPQLCPECGGISFSDLILAEKKDACYYKVKASAKVWPSAYASGRLVQCRKKGAANYGNSKTEGVAENNAVKVPPGQQAIIQPDGSIRISKPGSVSRADYAKNMAAYKAQTQTPEKIADFKQRMASGQGYTDAERQANLQQQQQHFGKYADTGDLDEQGVTEVSLGDYRKKAAVSQAGAKIDRFFGRDDAAKVAAADRTIAKREKGLSRADARRKPYTPPPMDKEKQRQLLTDKYPNIDQLVSDAEKNRDPYYDRAEGNAYYAGREAEQNYVRLKQIQRIIQGLNEETKQATVNVPGASLTANKSTNTVSGQTNVGGAALSATKNITPGGGGSVSASMPVTPNLNLTAKQTSPDYNKGQLAGTKSVSATYTDTAGALGKPGQQHTATRTAGVGFGGASGPRVGKNYVDQIDKTLADYMKEAKGINSIRNPNDLQPLEAGGGMGGGGGRTTSGPSPFGAKPGSREASVAQNNPNTMTIKQTTNPDYVPPKTLQQKYDDLNKKLDQLPPAKPPRPGRAAADQRRLDQARASELKDVVPLSPAEKNQLRPVDANNLRRSGLDKSLDLGLVRPGIDEQQELDEKWSQKYKSSINCANPRGFSQKAHCAGRKKNEDVAELDEGGDVFMPNIKDTAEYKAGLATGKLPVPYPEGTQEYVSYYKGVIDRASPTLAKVGEGEQQKGADYRDPKEVDYDDEYDAMVARVKKLAGLGPMKTVYDPNRRQYRNMPTAVQPTKK